VEGTVQLRRRDTVIRRAAQAQEYFDAGAVEAKRLVERLRVVQVLREARDPQDDAPRLVVEVWALAAQALDHFSDAVLHKLASAQQATIAVYYDDRNILTP